MSSSAKETGAGVSTAGVAGFGSILAAQMLLGDKGVDAGCKTHCKLPIFNRNLKNLCTMSAGEAVSMAGRGLM